MSEVDGGVVYYLKRHSHLKSRVEKSLRENKLVEKAGFW